MNQETKFKLLCELMNEIGTDGYDIGFYVPGPMDPDPFTRIMLGYHDESEGDQGVEVLSYLRFDSSDQRWSHHEGDVE